jgi:hypothetical protein
MSTIINSAKAVNTLCDKESSVEVFFNTLVFQYPSQHITEALATVMTNDIDSMNKDLYCITIEICKPAEEVFLKWKESISKDELTKSLVFQINDCSTMKELVKKHVRECLKTLFKIENFTNEAEADVTVNLKINLFPQHLTDEHSFKKQESKKKKQRLLAHEDIRCCSNFICVTVKRQDIIIQGFNTII